MKRTLKIYVAGPISGPTITDIFEHLRIGGECTNRLMRHGLSPYPTFTNYLLYMWGTITNEEFYAADMPWLEASDAVLMLPRWEQSKGAMGEHKRAEECNIPIFYSESDLLKWKEEQDAATN